MHDRSVQTRALPFVLVKGHVTSGLRPRCPADGCVCQVLHVVEGNRTLEAVLVSSTPSLVRTTTPGYLAPCQYCGWQGWFGECGQEHATQRFHSLFGRLPIGVFPHPEENMGTLKRTRKNDSIDAAQNAPTHHRKRKENTRKRLRAKKEEKMAEEVGKQDDEEEEEKEKEKGNNANSEDETNDGNSSNADRDKDRDISFMNDTDEEIDTAEIEEEDWIEYIKRSTDEAMQRMETAISPMLDQSSQKNEMETGDENRIVTGRKMGCESSRMEP